MHAVQGVKGCRSQLVKTNQSLMQLSRQPATAGIKSAPILLAESQALCAYANCTIVEGTNPPVAECGCQVSRTTLKSDAYSCGTATTVLDKNLQSAMEQVRCQSEIALN